MPRWDVTIEVDGETTQTYPNARVTIGPDTAKLHHDREPSSAEVADFVEGAGTFFDATEELWVQSCLVVDGSLELVVTEFTGGASDIQGALQMKWTLKPA